MSARTSAANGKEATTKPPRPVEALARGETLDERLTMIAIQVDHVIRRVTEAMAGLLMCVGYALCDEEAADPAVKRMPDFVHAAFARLDDAMRGSQE